MKGECRTLKAFIGFLLCMKSMIVFLEGWMTAKDFPTLITPKRIFSSMKSLTCHEVCVCLFFFSKKVSCGDYVNKASPLYEFHDTDDMGLLALGFPLWWCSQGFSLWYRFLFGVRDELSLIFLLSQIHYFQSSCLHQEFQSVWWSLTFGHSSPTVVTFRVLL